MKRMGERVKKRREELKMQLSEMAKEVGVTISLLSQIENGKAFPSIFNLKRIADVLHTTVSELIGENENVNNNPIIRSDEIRFIRNSESGAGLYLLSHHDIDKKMETCMIQFPPNTDSGDLMPQHHGQEYCYIINGNVKMSIGDKEYSLNEGDNIYFNSNTEHKIVSNSKKLSKVLWIITPPNI